MDQKNSWIVIVVTILVVGGGLLWWQNSQSNVLRREIQILQKQNKTLASEIGKLSQNSADAKKPSPTNTVSQNTNSTLCTAAPTGTDMGRDVYPIDSKYKNIEFLGQLFTAFTCGSERLSKIDGVKADNYTLGSTVWLTRNPNSNLINTFKEIGYTCKKDISDNLCREWKLWDVVKVIDLMKLEPFHENFEADDCTQCG